MQIKTRCAKKRMKAVRKMSRTHFETHFSRGWRSLGLSQSTEIVIRLKAPAFILSQKGTSIVKKRRSGAFSLPGKLPAPNNPREFFVGIGSGSPLPLINAYYLDDLWTPVVRVYRSSLVRNRALTHTRWCTWRRSAYSRRVAVWPCVRMSS